MRAGTNEATGVGQRVILDIAGHGSRPGIDGDHSAAVGAPSRMRAALLVECQVPEDHATGPVARAVNDQGSGEPREALVPVLLPLSPGAFREVGVLVRVRRVNERLGLHGSLVAMPRDPGDVAGRGRIPQNSQGGARCDPVMVPLENQRSVRAPGKQRAQVPANELGARGGLEGHSGIVPGLEARLVLHGDRVERKSRGRIGVCNAQQILREGVIRVGTQPPSHELPRVLHPRRRAPRRGHYAEPRIDGPDLVQERKQVMSLRLNREMRERRIRLTARTIVEAVMPLREVSRPDRDAHETQADTGRLSEEIRDQIPARGLAQLLRHERDARIRQRRTEADDLLVAPRGVHLDRERCHRLRAKRQVGLARQELRAIARRQPHVHGGWSAVGRRSTLLVQMLRLRLRHATYQAGAKGEPPGLVQRLLWRKAHRRSSPHPRPAAHCWAM